MHLSTTAKLMADTHYYIVPSLFCDGVVLPVQGDMHEHLAHLRSTAVHRWFQSRHVRAFYTSLAAPGVRLGVQALLQVRLYLTHNVLWKKIYTQCVNTDNFCCMPRLLSLRL